MRLFLPDAMLTGIQVFLIITGVSVATVFPFLIHRSQSNLLFRSNGLKTLVVTTIISTATLWWMNPNVQLQLTASFWLLAVLSFALFYRTGDRIHFLPTSVIMILGGVLLYRITGRIIPVEQMVIVMGANLLSGIVISVFLYGGTYPNNEKLDPDGNTVWILLIATLSGRLLWDGFQMIGGKTESRFGEAEPIYIFFQPLDWWYLFVGLAIAILLPLIVAIVQMVRQKDINQSTVLTMITLSCLIIGQSILLQFITQYGIVF